MDDEEKSGKGKGFDFPPDKEHCEKKTFGDGFLTENGFGPGHENALKKSAFQIQPKYFTPSMIWAPIIGFKFLFFLHYTVSRIS